jgi:hypothetical protein
MHAQRAGDARLAIVPAAPHVTVAAAPVFREAPVDARRSSRDMTQSEYTGQARHKYSVAQHTGFVSVPMTLAPPPPPSSCVCLPVACACPGGVQVSGVRCAPK